jgi:hypothetical protein
MKKFIKLENIPEEYKFLCMCGNCIYWNNSYLLIRKCKLTKEIKDEDKVCEKWECITIPESKLELNEIILECAEEFCENCVMPLIMEYEEDRNLYFNNKHLCANCFYSIPLTVGDKVINLDNDEIEIPQGIIKEIKKEIPEGFEDYLEESKNGYACVDWNDGDWTWIELHYLTRISERKNK